MARKRKAAGSGEEEDASAGAVADDGDASADDAIAADDASGAPAAMPAEETAPAGSATVEQVIQQEAANTEQRGTKVDGLCDAFKGKTIEECVSMQPAPTASPSSMPRPGVHLVVVCRALWFSVQRNAGAALRCACVDAGGYEL